jgi:TetR/AcrR family transcriptional regulator, transcriptional repressor for nem operon
MPREPTTERGRRSRDRIVESATELVASRGVEGTGIDHVLAAAGASKSQLYHYFVDKEDLIRAVIARRFDQVVTAQAPLLASLDSWAAIRRWLDLFVGQTEAAGHQGCPIGTLANELADRDETARADLAACFAAWEGSLIAGLTRMKRRGDLVPNADPRQLAMAVFASLQGGLLLAKTHKDVEPLRVALDAAYGHLRSFRPAKTRKGTGSSR